MLGFIKRATSAVLAGVFVVGYLALYPNFIKGRSSISAATLSDSATLVNYATILGRDVDYGIITDSFTQKDHIESTLATNSFKRDCDSQFDVDLTTNKTAQFIIGGLEAPYRDIKFGSVHKDRHEVYVKNINIVFADNINPGTQVKKQDDVAKTTEFNYSFLNKAEIKSHIDSIIGHAKDESDQMVRRTNDKNYVLDTKYVKYNKDSKVTTINIDSDEYTNSVVYVNLDDPAFRNLLSIWKTDANGRHLVINKKSSTVVVFTYQGTADITLGKVEVIAKDSALYASAGSGADNPSNKYASTTTYSGDISAHNNYVDQEIARKMIWNIPNASNVTITGSAGTFMALKKGVNTKISGSPSAGWLVANGRTQNSCEFHYIYCGASENLQTEGNGQMHFTMHKRFTDKYDTKENVIPDNSVSFDKGAYEFFWQEYADDSFTNKVGDRSTCAIDQNSIVEFPTLTFVTDDPNNIHYVQPGTSRDFYFRITENPDKTLTGISNSSGYVDIRLNVYSDANGKITFKTQNRTFIQEDTDHAAFLYAENGKWMKEDNKAWVDVVGNRFDHTMGNISILLYLDSLGKKGCIIDDYSEIEIVSDKPVYVEDSYSYFSLLNMTGCAKGIKIEGAKYPLDGGEITCDYQYGISNEVLPGKRACICVGEGRLLLVKVF